MVTKNFHTEALIFLTSLSFFPKSPGPHRITGSHQTHTRQIRQLVASANRILLWHHRLFGRKAAKHEEHAAKSGANRVRDRLRAVAGEYRYSFNKFYFGFMEILHWRRTFNLKALRLEDLQ